MAMLVFLMVLATLTTETGGRSISLLLCLFVIMVTLGLAQRLNLRLCVMKLKSMV